MHAHAKAPFATIVPTLRYRNVAAAIDWLCNAFGFERHVVVPGENGSVRYAELTFGRGMIMLGPVEGSSFDKLMTQPDEAGAETQICYLFVDDAASHRARAAAAGAEIVLDIEERGGRGYSCRDLEGHIWNFGTYDPWKRGPAEAVSVDRPRRGPSRVARHLGRVALVAGLLVCAAASAIVVDWALAHREPRAAAGAAGDTVGRESLERERWAREAAERSNRAAREQAALERQAKEAAERAARDAQATLAQERAAREAAERAAREAREQLTKAGSDQAAREMRQQLARERSALEAAQRIARETQEQLALTERDAETLRNELAAERNARETAERVRQQLEAEYRLKEEAERGKLAREVAAKERAAREAADRAAKEAAERAAMEARERRHGARRPASHPPTVASTPTPFTDRSDN